jgi:hypothetical protein
MIRTTLVGLLVLAAAAMAQPPGPGRGPGRGGMMGRVLGAEAGMPGRVVKNSPYVADVVTEVTQTLGDGNHIKQTSTVHVSRDSEGRTRREQSLQNLNGLAPNAKLPHMVFIHDPVAGTSYALNSDEKTATRSTFTPHAGGPNGGPGRGPGPRPGIRANDVTPPPPGGAGRPEFHRRDNANVKTESLGRQSIEGVPADGTRTTMTIPAGQMGNEQPIQVVNETWFSPDLQAVVMAKRSDPRNGDTVTRVTNVSRSEPPRTQFEVPSDFKVSDAHRGRGPQQ